MASIGSEHAPRPVWRTSVPWGEEIRRAVARGRALLTDRGDSSPIHRLAGAAFVIRVVSAAITFVSQILLARWMGSFDFGIFIYGWTWLLLVGAMVDLGFGSSAQRFIPNTSSTNSSPCCADFSAAAAGWRCCSGQSPGSPARWLYGC